MKANQMVNVTINGRKLLSKPGQTILELANENGVHIPTLCYHPMLKIAGSCRVCLVEDMLSHRLLPSCNTVISEGMEIETSNERVEKSVKSDLKFLRCRHPNSCMTCEVSGNYELQRLAYHFQVDDTLPRGTRQERTHSSIDGSSNSILKDMTKCILCTRCIRACGMDVLGIVERGANEYVSTFGDIALDETDCISCGQCTAVCPVGALIERPAWHAVNHLLQNKRGKIVVAHTAPAVRIAISEEFDSEPGTISTGKLVAGLKELGFDYVFDTQFAADLTIVEEATEFIDRLSSSDSVLPMFTSCCPAWVNLVEKSYGEKLLPHLSSCKSPQSMMGTLMKTVFAQKIGIHPDDIVTVGIMPCVAKKDEINRPQLHTTNREGKSIRETEYVLTTRELARMLRDSRVLFNSLKPQPFDRALGSSSGAAALFGATGGVMEAAIRSAHYYLTGEDLSEILALRPVDSMPGVRAIYNVPVGPKLLNVAIVTGTKNIREMIDKVLAGDKSFDLIEVMACPGGCIGGGGEPKWNTNNSNTLMKRIEAVHKMDASSTVRQSHHNVEVAELYNSLGKERAHHLLLTSYTDRTSEVKYSNTGPFGPTTPKKQD